MYASLFKNSHGHETIVKALATKNKGLTRNEIVQATGIKSGGGLSGLLEELIQCGFVKQLFPIQKTKDDALFRLVDEYTLFYFKFLQNNKSNSSWLHLSNKQTYKIWSGFAFENLCFKHIYQIKKALGINGIVSNEYSWTLKGEAQIDLLIDRDDNCINLLEIKYYDGPYEITKGYAAQLQEKVAVFKQSTRTKKNLFVTLLTVFGTKKNEHYLSNITNEIVIEDLFK